MWRAGTDGTPDEEGYSIAVGSRKRWQRMYSDGNPFELPQSITKRIKSCAKEAAGAPQPIDYLWVYVGPSAGSVGEAEPECRLQVEEWLSVIDEAAALGAHCIIISTGVSFSECPEIIDICDWAQTAHGMSVGIHVYGEPLSSDDVKRLAALDSGKMGLFVDNGLLESMVFAQELGIDVRPAKAQDGQVVEPTCTLPEVMPCVGPAGAMYTCGLVLGEERYSLGNVFDRKLGDIMSDEDLPHCVPEGYPKDKRQCDGCPPFMFKELRSRDG